MLIEPQTAGIKQKKYKTWVLSHGTRGNPNDREFLILSIFYIVDIYIYIYIYIYVDISYPFISDMLRALHPVDHGLSSSQ